MGTLCSYHKGSNVAIWRERSLTDGEREEAWHARMLQNERPPLIRSGLKGFVSGDRFQEKVTVWLDCHLCREGAHEGFAAGFGRLMITHMGIDHRVRDVLVAGPLLDGINIRVLRGHHGAQRVP
jgi:hypothetical protein